MPWQPQPASGTGGHTQSGVLEGAGIRYPVGPPPGPACPIVRLGMQRDFRGHVNPTHLPSEVGVTIAPVAGFGENNMNLSGAMEKFLVSYEAPSLHSEHLWPMLIFPTSLCWQLIRAFSLIPGTLYRDVTLGSLPWELVVVSK